MPEDAQHCVFQPTFSAKGEGRGLGAWSMKLLAEGSLSGAVWFSSTPADGTIFLLQLPFCPSHVMERASSQDSPFRGVILRRARSRAEVHAEGSGGLRLRARVQPQLQAGRGDAEGGLFFEVNTWSLLAEVCGAYLKKSRGVRVVGRQKQNRWTSPEGQGRSKVMIVAEHVEFKPNLKGKDGDGDGKDAESGAAEAPAGAAEEPAVEDAELKEAASF